MDKSFQDYREETYEADMTTQRIIEMAAWQEEFQSHAESCARSFTSIIGARGDVEKIEWYNDELHISLEAYNGRYNEPDRSEERMPIRYLWEENGEKTLKAECSAENIRLATEKKAKDDAKKAQAAIEKRDRDLKQLRELKAKYESGIIASN